ncbi:alpha/beta fold hydrolase [Veronia pacifica]|uniref:Alpha/beta hydrolase n=1 Tax=Veronia pacifica TaxID=1080227 RepID=A0A1C3EG80_9GAMM|nr:alpha/beta fold hydrolase [Veronia pacifica]ODA32238.1 alpha/beta hydrolase [Veronia pacifica]
MQDSFIEDGILYRQHTFSLPLDYARTSEKQIKVFARELVDESRRDCELPWLVYLQGGPGYPSPRPGSASGWMKRALRDHRVLLLDQRGTGNSTPVTHQTLAHMTVEQQVDYLSLFRADNIVRDAEEIRQHMGIKKWSLLGQSFGGFCSLTYLSFYPESLKQVYITGGVPSLSRHADDVYRATYQRVKDKNAAFFAQFPKAQTLCRKVADYLDNNEVMLPNGQRFTTQQFQLIGINFGGSGAYLPMYYLLEEAFVDLNGQETLSYTFLNEMLAQQSYQTNPIYAILHEPIYNQQFASQWSANRVRNTEYPEFNYQAGQPFLFTGEMVFPWMFEQLNNLKPLKQAAEKLAEKSDWSNVYNPEQLSKNKVPVACAVYADDMYVEMDYSRETLRNIPNSKAWITNEYEHNGLRADGERILDKLISMADSIEALPTS